MRKGAVSHSMLAATGGGLADGGRGYRELKAAMDDIGVELNDSELDTMMSMADLDR